MINGKSENLLIFYFLFFIALSLTIFLHPTKEFIECDEQYNCTVHHQFLGFININNKIQLNSNSQLIFAEQESAIMTDTSHRIFIDDKEIFIYPFVRHFWKQSYLHIDKENRKIAETLRLFNSYVNNPQLEFKVQNQADPLILFIFIGCLLFAFFDIYRKLSK